MEEVLLLTVHQLGRDAYGVPVRKRVEELTGKKFSIGAVYVPLERLVTKGLLNSYEAAPTPQRGGRRKRYYEVTTKGIRALTEIREINDRLWANAPALRTSE